LRGRRAGKESKASTIGRDRSGAQPESSAENRGGNKGTIRRPALTQMRVNTALRALGQRKGVGRCHKRFNRTRRGKTAGLLGSLTRPNVRGPADSVTMMGFGNELRLEEKKLILT